MSFIVDRIKEIETKDESRETYLSERETVESCLERLLGVIEEANDWSRETRPRFHERLDRYIDAIIVKGLCDSWDPIDDKVDLDCLRLTLAVYQKKLSELDAALSKKLDSE
jgi:hypothetical protein